MFISGGAEGKNPFLQISCSNVRGKLYQKLGFTVTKIVKKIKFKGVWGRVRSKKLFPETIIHNMFETDSGFYVKKALR